MSVILSRGDNRVGGVSSDAVLRREYAKRMTAPGQAVLRRHGADQSLTAQVQALFAKYSAAGGMWDMRDASTLRQNSGGTGAVADGDPIGYATDLSGNGNHLTQATAANRPAFNSATGATFDGVNDQLAGSAAIPLTHKSFIGVCVNRLSHNSSLEVFRVSANTHVSDRHSINLQNIQRANGMSWLFSKSIQGLTALSSVDFAPLNSFSGLTSLVRSAGGNLTLGGASDVATTASNWASDESTGASVNYVIPGSTAIAPLYVRRSIHFSEGLQLTADDRTLIHDWLMEGV